jgi:D-alanyl-D-alanine carboxypeptidase
MRGMGQNSVRKAPRRQNLCARSLALLLVATQVLAADGGNLDTLVNAYGEHIAETDGHTLVMKSGARIAIDDEQPQKSHADWLARPDIKDMFRYRYDAATEAAAPPADHDPGRARTSAVFDAIYGDCRAGTAQRNLVDVPWLPRHGGGGIKVTAINGVAARLAAISAELERLPADRIKFLVPAAGGFNCRSIAGSTQKSPHGWGIAVDIAIANAHYWQWSKPENGRRVWRNAIPMEIVRVFESHGFIWGGRWDHFDTMHFEFRPELLPPTAPLAK